MPVIEHPWIVCARGHEVRVLPLSNEGSKALQVRVGGVAITTTILGPQARLALAEALTDAR